MPDSGEEFRGAPLDARPSYYYKTLPSYYQTPPVRTREDDMEKERCTWREYELIEEVLEILRFAYPGARSKLEEALEIIAKRFELHSQIRTLEEDRDVFKAAAAAEEGAL